MNTVWGFAMFFYTQALGIAPELTGWILAIPMIWDAVTDPVMGFITDNTKSRFGRRHPHVLIGGVLLAMFYFFLWYVPDVFQSSQKITVLYLVAVNLISRTLMTWYYVPYVALGFEICTDYNERSKLQSTRFVVNMIFNLLFCGILVWRVFLVDADGNRDTTIQANYARMGLGFGLVILALILITVFSTRRYASDTRKESAMMGKGLKGFLEDMVGIFRDWNAAIVFLFFCVVNCSFVFVASIQMYVYVSFMDLSPFEASATHSSTMIGFAIGSLISAPIARRFDKKPAVYIGAAINVLANVMLGVIFLTGWLTPQMMPFWKTSVASMVFWFFHAAYWCGTGFLMPIVFSMIADVSAINHLKTGHNKDGSYSAVLTFLTKVTSSVALIAVGFIMTLTGFAEGSDVQPPEVAFRLTQMMIFLGIFFTVLAALFLIKYPVNRVYMEKMRSQYAIKPVEKSFGKD
jgi:glycoside/pentoside/hexuronide:cation symporter, GPH family